MQTYGLHFSHYRNGSKVPVIREYTFKDTETITKGDPVNLESGEVDLGASGDTAIIGVAAETKSGTDSVTKIKVILDNGGDAVWRIYDASARTEGTELDITGTTGAITLAADSDSDVIVHANSTATEPTLVRIHPRAFGLTVS